MRYYGSTISLVIRLQPLNFLEEKINLIYIATPGILTGSLNRGLGVLRRKDEDSFPT